MWKASSDASSASAAILATPHNPSVALLRSHADFMMFAAFDRPPPSSIAAAIWGRLISLHHTTLARLPDAIRDAAAATEVMAEVYVNGRCQHLTARGTACSFAACHYYEVREISRLALLCRANSLIACDIPHKPPIRGNQLLVVEGLLPKACSLPISQGKMYCGTHMNTVKV